MIKQDGLEWVAETFGLEPRWSSEPDIAKVESISRKHLNLKENDFCHLSFYAQGAFNKLYKVEIEDGCFLVRVTLPVDPSNKTNSEVATINFIRQTTDIPVPQILAFDDSNDEGTITGIIDWECVSTLPLWKSCDFPEFLKGKERNEEPNRNNYAPEDEEDANEPAADALDNEGTNDLFWEHLLEYESTMLRTLFLDEMQKIAPEWIEESTKGAGKADFEIAVQHCDGGWSVKRLTAWLDAIEKGENWSLRRNLYGYS
ncbi:hypothetical protein sscle_16g109910 [Sclerotinia sclerotiorum 1980 UF-70]|uniref:Uncharacterized protein n=1 Tax=Sclerotinia sclerotiorum (strain ATCC 18683 / 1980 / Ss-1) TaxID=665079 RepID=A0A1D9QMR9_SCLS1|nr:hypothetical protein sscle_16g109910 [Sclerotinia sclerotiorum 1980 UF-70]